MNIPFILPVPPNRANDSRNHWKVYRDKQAYYKECCAEIQRQSDVEIRTMSYIGNSIFRSEGKIKYPLEAIEWEAVLDVRQYMDFDNLVARLKWPLDCLKISGIIKDDKWQLCRPKSFPDQVLKPKKSDKRELRLTIYPRGSFY